MSDLPEHMLIVTARVDPSVETKWNHWYDAVHLPEILDCPGFIDARRYVTAFDGQREYVTVYRLASPTVLDGEIFNARRGWYQFTAHVTATVRAFSAIKMETGS
ncbi:DUF4286 family protein [Pacificispira sp.]|uniref:DUF4286 family protein n=1 Tax=Pacificispira sp. TaxID=2888761 RepID=UPI003B51DA24